MEEVDSRLVDQRWRTLLHQPKMTSVARRIVRYQPTGDALFPAASRMVRRPRPVDMSARNQRLRCASIRRTCMWCADAPAANGVTAEQPWHDLMVAGQGRTMPRLGVLAVTALMWSLINWRAQSDTMHYTLCLKKGYYPTTNDNFKNSCPIPVFIVGGWVVSFFETKWCICMHLKSWHIVSLICSTNQ